MSAAEQRTGSAPSTDGQDLAALRASARCGRSVPALHLVEADDTLTQPSWRVGSQEHIALCAALVDESTLVPDFEVCPGCPDCVRYCAACVREAQRFGAEVMTSSDRDTPAPGGGPDRAP